MSYVNGFKGTWPDSVMKILVVGSYYKPAYVYGGPTRSVSSLCEGLVQAGVEVTVLTTNANGATRLDVQTDRDLDINGVKVHYYPLAVGGSYFYSPSLVSAVQDRVVNFDLVVAEILWSHALGPTASACARSRRPFVIPTRGQLQPWALGQKSLKKRLYLRLVGLRNINRAAALHCTDYAEKETLTQLNLQPPAFVVPNGIDTARYAFMPERGGLRRRLDLPERAVVMLFVGRLNKVKRPDIAIKVLAAVQRIGLEQVHLVLAGPDEQNLMPELMQQAAELACEKHVHFTGLLSDKDLQQAFADSDLLIMPSDIQENFGMSALEALAAGVPILVSTGVPIGHWAEQAGAGQVVPCSVEAFTQAAVELLQAPQQLKAMGERGRTLARERFDTSITARQMLAQYQAIIATGRPLPDELAGPGKGAERALEESV